MHRIWILGMGDKIVSINAWKILINSITKKEVKIKFKTAVF